MNNQKLLEPFELHLIKFIKRSRKFTVDDIKKIYAEEYEVDPIYIKLSSIVVHLSNMLVSLNVTKISDLIMDAAPSEMYRYTINGEALGKKGVDLNYYECWLTALCSKIQITAVKMFPGYK